MSYHFVYVFILLNSVVLGLKRAYYLVLQCIKRILLIAFPEFQLH